MLSKQTWTPNTVTREEWREQGRRQREQIEARFKESEGAKPITDMATQLHVKVWEHAVEVIKLQSSLHPTWAEIRGDDEKVATRYKALNVRKQADDKLGSSLISARFGHRLALGDQLIPELKALVAWRRENPITGNPQDALAQGLEGIIAEAEQMGFVAKAQARAEALAASGINRS